MTLIKNLEKRNKWYTSLTPAQKRIEIARDVIRQIRNSAFSATRGKYLVFYIQRSNSLSSIQQLIEENKVTCSGCADGSLLYSYIHLSNNITKNNNKLILDKVKELLDCSIPFNTSRIDTRFNNKPVITRMLKKVFTKRMLDLIELAFEGRIDPNTNNYITITSSFKTETIVATKKYIKNYPIGNDRLIAICKNIIKNKGTFKP